MRIELWRVLDPVLNLIHKGAEGQDTLTPAAQILIIIFIICFLPVLHFCNTESLE